MGEGEEEKEKKRQGERQRVGAKEEEGRMEDWIKIFGMCMIEVHL